MLAVRRDALRQHPSQSHHPGLGAARWEYARGGGAERHEADAARSPDAETSEDERHSLGDVRLQPPRGAERHRWRDVEHDPGRERALGHVQANVWLSGPGGRRRVDVAHVVADLVGAELRELDADRRRRRHADRREASGRRAG